MDYIPPEINPFQAPAAAIGPTLPGTGANDDAELIRRTYLNHEASIKSLGSLQYLGAIFAGLLAVVYGLAAAGIVDLPVNNADPNIPKAVIFGISTVSCLFGLAVNAALGYGLTHLQTWARWVTIVLNALTLFGLVAILAILAVINPTLAGGFLVVFFVPLLIVGYILYLVASAKGAMVCSPAYREVISQTPHIKYRTSLIVKIFVGLLLFVVGLVVLAGIASLFIKR